MANTSQGYDACSYQEKLRRSIGPGMYMLGTPDNDCDTCARDVPADPYLRYQEWGRGFCAVGAPVDDGSELRGLNYKNSRCANDAYLPGKYAAKGVCTPAGADKDPRKCRAPTEPTRLSNPPCTLRSTGWNRWQWLCWDPQERAIRPFEWNTSYRTVVKDNHTPIIEQPMDQSDLMPKAKAGVYPTMDGMQSPWTPPSGCGAEAPGNPFAPTMKTCSDIRKM